MYDRQDVIGAELAAVIAVAIARGWMEGFMRGQNPYTVRVRGEKVLIGRGTGLEPRSERIMSVRDAFDWIARKPESIPHRGTVDPLLVRAREAIANLGLDGSRLETAVAVFGWGSDEANGSLLGLVRAAWDWVVEVDVLADADGFEVVCPDMSGEDRALVGELRFGGDTEAEALVVALEAKVQP